jgi:hypothetical protein
MVLISTDIFFSVFPDPLHEDFKAKYVRFHPWG